MAIPQKLAIVSMAFIYKRACATMQLCSSRDEFVACVGNSMASRRKKSDSSNNEGKGTWTDDEVEL